MKDKEGADIQVVLKKLEHTLTGSIAYPGSEAYEKCIDIDNGRIKYTPFAVIYPDNEMDIVKSVNITKANGIHLTVRNGGHNAVDWCLNNDGVVLDMRNLNSISVDTNNETVTISCGLLWGYVYQFMKYSGYVPIGGGAVSVGVTGFTLGGGYSYLSRSKGLGVDNLLSINVVTADGEIISLGKNETDPNKVDLFWALRGGGGGNFAIATQMTCKIYKELPECLSGTIRWDIEHAKEVLMFYKDWMLTTPNEIDPLILLSNAKNNPTLLFLVYYNGPYEKGLEIMKPLLDFKPQQNTLVKSTFYEFMKEYGAPTDSKGLSTYIKAGNIKQTMSENFIDALIAGIKKAPSKETQIGVEYAGGVIAQVPSDKTAYPWRDIVARWEIKATWENEKNDQENIEWAMALAENIKTETAGADVNQQDQFLESWREGYYTANYERLLKTKKYWDAENYFHFPQSIGKFDSEAHNK